MTVYEVPEKYTYYTWPWKTIILRLYEDFMPVRACCVLSPNQTQDKRNGEHQKPNCSLVTCLPLDFRFFETLQHLVLVENAEQALPHLAGLLAGVNAAPDAGLLVVLAHGGGLSVVGGQTLGQGFGVVIGTLDQGLAGDVVLHVGLRGVEDLVVRAAGGRVHQTASDTSHEQRVVNLQLNGVSELLLAHSKHVIQALGLRDGPRETIQNETVISMSVYQSVRSSGGGDPYPFLHSVLFSSSLLIMFTMISSLTRPPWSMIFLASLPRSVFFATCDRSMSPVAYLGESISKQISMLYSREPVATYQVAHAVLVLDVRGLSSLA